MKKNLTSLVYCQYSLCPLPILIFLYIYFSINFLSPALTLLFLFQVIALLAFSITAGFSSGSTNNSMTCLGGNNQNNTVYITFSYPYSSGSFAFTPQEGTPGPNTTLDMCTQATQFSTRAFSSSAQFFVALGVLTMIYVIAALLIYMMFIIPDLFIAKWLVIGVSWACPQKWVC